MLTVVDDFGRGANQGHSSRIRALRMIAPHFSRSATRNTARRSGVFRSGAAGSAPSARNFVCNVGSASATIAAAFNRATIGSGVADGRNNAIQFEASKSFRPCSCAVATLGKLDNRARDKTAGAFSRPASI